MNQTVVILAGALAVSALAASSPKAQMSSQPQPPEALITNGQVRARIYLPDAQKGFYRSTRFDWSAAIPSLEYQGHQYYGPWFTKTDPQVRDFIYKDSDIVVSAQSGMVGPVEEFQTPQGYTTAKPGGTFVKVGVGVLRKPDDSRYSGYANYEIVDAGKWTVHTGADSVVSVQDVMDPASGYGYSYRKTLRLTPGKPEMVIEHSLKNTGKLPIETRQYNHNFLVLDKAPIGPDFTITFPFDIKTNTPPDKQFAEIRGHQIAYLKTLENQDRVTFGVQGFSNDPKDYDFRIESRKVGAGVRVTSDRPMASASLWSIRSVISMEPFVDVTTAPGGTTNWTYTYTYYTLPK
jgi:hypothetical protein